MVGRECCRVFCVAPLAESTQNFGYFLKCFDRTSAPRTSAPRTSRTGRLAKPNRWSRVTVQVKSVIGTCPDCALDLKLILALNFSTDYRLVLRVSRMFLPVPICESN